MEIFGRIGSTNTLRTPGGSKGAPSVLYEDGPTVTPGQDVYVILRDQGQSLGRNSWLTVVASDSDDVFTVQNGAVYGQGGFRQLVEPAATFEAHLLTRATQTSH
jgi:hypothetical protein